MSNSWLQHPTTSNLLKKSYVKSFVDVSGDVYVRNANVEGFNADISMNGTITCNSLTLTEGVGAGVNSDVTTALGPKQNTIVQGSGISITGDTISASSGSVSNVTETSAIAASNWTQLSGSMNSVTGSWNGQDDAEKGSTDGTFGHSILMVDNGTRVFVSSPNIDILASSESNNGLITIWDRVGSNWTRIGPAINTSYPLIGGTQQRLGWEPHRFACNTDGTILAHASIRYFAGVIKVYNINADNTITQMGSTINGYYPGPNLNSAYARLGGCIKITKAGTRLFATSMYYLATDSSICRPKMRIYDWDGTNWVLLSMLEFEFNAFKNTASNIAINSTGSIVAVGMSNASNTTGSNGLNNGHIIVYEYDGSNWVQKGSTIFPDQTSQKNLYFGQYVYMNDSGTMLVTPSLTTYNGVGYTLVYDWNGVEWKLRGGRMYDINGMITVSGDGKTICGRDPTAAVNLDMIARIMWWNGSSWVTKGDDIKLFQSNGLSMNSSGTRVVTGRPSLTNAKVITFDNVSGSQSFTNITENLEITGDINVLGNISVSGTTIHSSDIRIKTNLQTLTNCLSTIMKLSPEIYYKKNQMGTQFTRLIKESGFIAQEIWYNIPELRHLVILPNGIYPSNIQDMSLNRVKPVYKDIYDISTNGFINKATNQIEHYNDDDTITYEDIIDTNEYTQPNYVGAGWGQEPASINYKGLIAYLIKGMQELKWNIELQQEEIEALDSRI